MGHGGKAHTFLTSALNEGEKQYSKISRNFHFSFFSIKSILNNSVFVYFDHKVKFQRLFSRPTVGIKLYSSGPWKGQVITLVITGNNKTLMKHFKNGQLEYSEYKF